jgi:hypothetical protein
VCVKPGSSTAYLCPNTFSVTLKIYVTRREYPMCGALLCLGSDRGTKLVLEERLASKIPLPTTWPTLSGEDLLR